MVCMTVCVNFEGGVVGFTDQEYSKYKLDNPAGLNFDHVSRFDLK